MAAEEGTTTTEAVTPPVAATTTEGAPSPPGASASPWYESLPDGLKGEKMLHQFKDTAALAQSYLETKKMVGIKLDGMVKVPGPGAKPEEIAAYRAAVGVPNAPSDYKITVPADAPEGTQIDPARFEHFVKGFHELGITNEQMQGIANLSMREDAARKRAQTEQYAQELDTLAETWGTDVFNRRAGEVQALVRRYADPEFMKWLDTTGHTNHPGLFRMLFPIAREFAESGIIEPVGDSKDGDVLNLDQRIEANREAYLKAPDGSPLRKGLLDERERLLNLRAEVLGTK